MQEKYTHPTLRSRHIRTMQDACTSYGVADLWWHTEEIADTSLRAAVVFGENCHLDAWWTCDNFAWRLTTYIKRCIGGWHHRRRRNWRCGRSTTMETVCDHTAECMQTCAPSAIGTQYLLRAEENDAQARTDGTRAIWAQNVCHLIFISIITVSHNGLATDRANVRNGLYHMSCDDDHCRNMVIIVSIGRTPGVLYKHSAECRSSCDVTLKTHTRYATRSGQMKSRRLLETLWMVVSII